MKRFKNEMGNDTVAKYAKPEKIGTINSGNSLWNDYRVSGEMLDYRIISMENRPTERHQKRLTQAEKTLNETETIIIEFCKNNDIQLLEN